MIFLHLDHEVLRSNWGTLVTLVPELNSTLTASKLLSSNEQVNLICGKGCRMLEKSIIRLAHFQEVSNESKN